MSAVTGIEWTDATWNPIVGCSIVSPGCTNCYAMKDAWRKHHNPKLPHYRGLTKKVNGNAVWRGTVRAAPDHILTAPLHWHRPRKIFVNSMGDLFHETIPDEWIDRVFAVMALAPQHTFQVLTKRAERMRDYLSLPHIDGPDVDGRSADYSVSQFGVRTRMVLAVARLFSDLKKPPPQKFEWPLPNVWLGVSAERQEEADARIPLLLQTPAAARFVSCEPLLGPIDLRAIRHRDGDADVRIDALTAEAWVENSNSASAYTDDADGNTRLDWIIVGGESGKDASPMHPQWARDVRDQCVAAGVPFFFKQWGEWGAPKPGHARHLVSKDGRHVDDRDWDQAVGFDYPLLMSCLGKKAAGRLLDGQEWNEFPCLTTQAPKQPVIATDTKQTATP